MGVYELFDPEARSLYAFLTAERSALRWLAALALAGFLVGLGVGTGHATLSADPPGQPAPWRVALGDSIRATAAHGLLVGWPKHLLFGSARTGVGAGSELGLGSAGVASQQAAAPSAGRQDSSGGAEGERAASGAGVFGKFFSLFFIPFSSPFSSPSSPLVTRHDTVRAFDVLRETVVMHEGGYVHPDLGFLTPAPSGAARGLGMVRESHAMCQVRCHRPRTGYPDNGTPEGMMEEAEEGPCSPFVGAPCRHGGNIDVVTGFSRNTAETLRFDPAYRVEEVLLRIPLASQITRDVALDVLGPLLPPDVSRMWPLEELDDGPLLALLLAHERGLGRDSAYYAYIATLPAEPLCGYWPKWGTAALDAITTYGLDMGMDVNGWAEELLKTRDYADRIAAFLADDYGPYLSSLEGEESIYDPIRWAFCHVVSRAVGGSDIYGALRLVPMLDVVNHHHASGQFQELNGTESVRKGDWLDAIEDDAGTFVLRSTLYGERKPLRKGQELLANYNVPMYSALDWFVNLGFLPREKMGRWKRLDGVRMIREVEKAVMAAVDSEAPTMALGE